MMPKELFDSERAFIGATARGQTGMACQAPSATAAAIRSKLERTLGHRDAPTSSPNLPW